MMIRKLKSTSSDAKPSKRALFLRSSVTIFILITVLEIWLVNRLSSYGEHLNEIKRSQAALTTENQILENKLAKGSSLNDLEKTASQLGFIESKSIDYIKPQAVASR